MYIKSNLKDELNYYELNSTKRLIVNFYFDDGTFEDCTENCSIQIFDTNVSYNTTTKEFSFTKEGSASIKILLLDNATGNYYSETLTFLVYEPFFKTNYLTSYFSEYDSKLIQKNEKLKVIMDALMQYLDVLYAYKSDIESITDPRNVKSKYLQLLGQTFGFEKIDFTNENTATEAATDFLYREILVNLFDILQIRGTKLSYELFFNALGFDIKLEEFWFNQDGDLVQIDVVEDDNGDINSTFLTYDTTGAPVLAGPELSKDPRKYNTPNSPYYITNKSNYVRPLITNKIENVGQIASFTAERKKIIKKYLEFLRPQHIQYLTAVLSANLSYVYDNDGNLLQDSEILLLFNTITETYTSAKQYCLDNTEDYSDPITIDSIELLDTNLINVVFNKRAKAPNSFVTPSINDLTHFSTTNTLASVRRIPNEKNKLQLRFTGATPGADTVNTTNISDLFNNLTASDSANFVLPANLVGPFLTPEVTSIQAISRRLIRVQFNTELDYDSVIDLNNYSVLDHALEIESVFLNTGLTSIDIYLKTDMIHNQSYTITISNIFNYDLGDNLVVVTKNFIGFGYDDLTVTNQPIMLPECGSFVFEDIDWNNIDEKYLRASNKKLTEIFGYFLRWDDLNNTWDSGIIWDQQKNLVSDSITITNL